MQYRLQTNKFQYGKLLFNCSLEADLLELSGHISPSPKTLGEYIRKSKIDKNLNSKEFAKIIKCNHNSLLGWERDKRIPSISYLKKLKDTLKIPQEFLIQAISDKYQLTEREKNLLFEFEILKQMISECLKKRSCVEFNFGSLLRILRLSLLLSHQDFAKALKVNPATLLDWENKRHYPSEELVERVEMVKFVNSVY